MEILHEENFIKGAESMIQPMAVSDLLFLQRLKGLLPSFLMKKLLYRAARKTPYIGFVIEPYSLFLFFKLKDFEAAKAMLPERYELAKTRLFEDDEPEYYMGMGNLGTRASTFWGTRQEVYLIATDKMTGLTSFIFIDILSNTLIALPSRGIVNPNCKKAIFTTSSKGEVYLDVCHDKTNRMFQLTGSIKNGVLKKLDQQLWVMGNTSIGYSKDLARGDDHLFAVIFDPAEVEEALDIPPDNIRIAKNTLFPGLAEPEACRVICFPYAQHYIADSPGCSTPIKDINDLISKYNRLADYDNHRVFSAGTIVKQLVFGFLFMLLITLLFIFLL